MIEIKFSKPNSNIFQIETDEKLSPYVRINLKQEDFKNSENELIWQKTSDDNQVIEIIYNLFSENRYKIIPDLEINKIIEQFEQLKKEYQEFIEIGIKIKKDKNPDLPKIELAKDSNGKEYSLKSYQKMPIKHMITIPNSANFPYLGLEKH